jgi:hypothetical protein
MADFRSLMDEEYLDYYALCNAAISDIKNLDREDNRFLQIIHMQLNSHRKNLDTDETKKGIPSNEMVNKHRRTG